MINLPPQGSSGVGLSSSGAFIDEGRIISQRQWGALQATINTLGNPIIENLGQENAWAAPAASATVISAFGRRSRYLTAAAPNSDTYIESYARTIPLAQPKLSIEFTSSSNYLASCRYLLGFAASGYTTMLGSADPAGGVHYVLLSADTTRNAVWTWITKDAVAQTATPTTVAFGTATDRVQVRIHQTAAAGSTWVVSLIIDGVMVDGPRTLAGNLPLTTQVIHPVICARTLAAASREFEFKQWNWNHGVP